MEKVLPHDKDGHHLARISQLLRDEDEFHFARVSHVKSRVCAMKNTCTNEKILPTRSFFL